MAEFIILSVLLIAVVIPTARRRPETLTERRYGFAVAALGYAAGVLIEALPFTHVGHTFRIATFLTAVIGFLCARQLNRATSGWARLAIAEPPPEGHPRPRLMHPLIAIGLVLSGLPMIWNVVTLRHEALENERQTRNVEAGVIVGAEAVTNQPLVAGRVAGRAPDRAVLLLHGFLSTRTDFADLADRLVDRGFTVRSARLPGHGETATALMQVEIDDYVEHVLAEYDALAETHARVSVVGFSVGAALTTLVAQERDPHRVVLANPFQGEIVTPDWAPLDVATVLPILSSITPRVIRPEAFARINRREGLEGHLLYRTVPLPAVERLGPLAETLRERGVPGGIRAPTLVLLSENDHVVPSALGAALFDDLPLGDGDKRLVRYAQSDHILFRDHDGPAAVEEAVQWLIAGD